MTRVTQQAFADHVGIDKSAVSRMVRDGIIDLKKGIDTARFAYIDRLREQAAGRLGVDPSEYDLTAERARLAHHQADKTELETSQLRGDLVPSEQVCEMLETVISNARAKLLTLPVKVAQAAVHATDLKEIETEVQVLIHQALDELSQSNGNSGHPTKGAQRLGATAALNS